MRKGLAVLGLSLVGVLTLDLVGAGATTPGPTITSTVNCRIGATCTATYTISDTQCSAFSVSQSSMRTVQRPLEDTVNSLPAYDTSPQRISVHRDRHCTFCEDLLH